MCESIVYGGSYKLSILYIKSLSSKGKECAVVHLIVRFVISSSCHFMLVLASRAKRYVETLVGIRQL